MILVTGATGGYGNSTIHALLNKGIPASNIAALVRNKEKASDLKSKGIELRIGDYSDYNSLVKAFQGIDKLLFVSGNDIKARENQHKKVIKAAIEANINHVVYTSFIRNTSVEDSAIGFLQDSHAKTEKWLKESSLNYTILQNASYFENIPMFIGENVLDTGVISLPAKEGKSNSVLRDELAEVTAHILVSEGHNNKIYSLTNPEAFSYKDVAEILTKISRKEIIYQSPKAGDYQETLKQYGVPEEYIELLTAFSLAQAKGELELSDNSLEILLNRKPTTIKEYLSNAFN
ncbi:SDR family oxidoreductase [Tenacibaculum sp.]|uniref:SDR family oxidoreductase n=1 Tax=Tenacibaculum sp. TaxID=1906242 RepID=UPI003D14E146